MKRRQLLQYLPLTTLPLSALALLAPASHAETEFERYQRQQQEGLNRLQSEWQQYRRRYLSAYRDYKQRLNTVWSKPELSSQTRWVDYNDDLSARRVIDFANNEVRLSFANTDQMAISEARIRAEFEKTLQASIQQAYRNDPVLTQVTGAQTPDADQSVSQIPSADIPQLLARASTQQQQTGKGTVVTVTIPLAADALPKRARGYLPQVKRAAHKWQVPVPLVLAIMQTESAFNPMARSHIPAFGLMQIVPGSAGRDASKHAFGRERLLSGQELFQPATNIELGCAYLNLLDTRYLKAIKHPQSRLFCTIAAYNTGAGNVARAFSGNTSVTTAAKRINRLTPTQVYAHLRQHLKYEEARNYLYKVTQAMPAYQA